MPHIGEFLLNGKKIPSVNECTDSLSKEGLIKNFYRRQGFKRADKISEESRQQGSDMAAIFEEYRKGRTVNPQSDQQVKCLQEWTTWFNASPYIIAEDAHVEAHLVNVVDEYHGSPDIVLTTADDPTAALLGDDKVKKRFADYKLLMNEHAYAMCDHYEVDGVLKPVPWKVPIPAFLFWTYHPVTGKLFPKRHEFDVEVYKDFLICKQMLPVNRKAEAYFLEHAVKLPEGE